MRWAHPRKARYFTLDEKEPDHNWHDEVKDDSYAEDTL